MRSSGQIRATVYGFLASTGLPMIIGWTSGQMPLAAFVVWTVILCLAAVATEGYLAVRGNGAKVLVADSQVALTKRFVDLPRLIEGAGAGGIDILGGTLKTFTDDRRTLEALRKADVAGTQIRILMIDPDGDGIEQMARQRKAVRSSASAAALRMEARQSLQRLADELGSTKLQRIAKVYQDLPHHSVYRIGSSFLVTVYRFGKGGSSPALFVVRGPRTKEFCDGFEEGFQDVWDAATTVPMSDAKLRAEPSPSTSPEVRTEPAVS